MSLASVRPFIRERLEGLGFTEHDEPFLPGQIGANITDGAFHIQSGQITSGPANQIVHSFECPITVRIYKTGHSQLLEAFDSAYEIADTVLADLLNPGIRLGSSLVKDIIPNSIEATQLGELNDNVIVLELAFTLKLELNYKT